MNLETIRQIEERALNAWPAAQQMLCDGWVLRFANGYTKRANSVNCLYPGVWDVAEKIEFCEEMYRQKGLPPIFRLTPLADENLDPALAGRGYRKIDPTRVLTLNLRAWEAPVSPKIALREMPLEQWMGVFSQISGSLVEQQPAHAEILRGILNPYLTAALEISGKWVACGLGVLERGWFGLFDIVTHPTYRRQGLGLQLVSSMLGWAQAQGAEQSYLQVMEENVPALGLYAKLGYTEAYGYWYRVPDKALL